MPYQSLAVQARWLTRRLEKHILGNHLFTNAKALVHAGLYFDGPEADRWYARGMQLISRALPEQVLPDGGHFELSPMYHALFLEDLLDLLNVLRAFGRQPPHEWLTGIASMQRWLQVMSHPDGDIAFFNDAAFGIAPQATELAGYAARLDLPTVAALGGPVIVLESSGYARLAAGDVCVLCDCAEVGPDQLPAHAHADSLSFEMSIGTQRLFVNSGVSQYGTDAERQRQRGTAANNTVIVNDRNSSEVWSGFRVARRARTRTHEVVRSPPASLYASHNGYRWLAGRNEHRRRWTLFDGSLQIDDEITGEFRAAAALFHLHPQIAVHSRERDTLVLDLPARPAVRMSFRGAGTLEVRPGTWHPEFGRSVANTCITVPFSGPTLRTRILWDRKQ